jgi:hypothetical protein
MKPFSLSSSRPRIFSLPRKARSACCVEVSTRYRTFTPNSVYCAHDADRRRKNMPPPWHHYVKLKRRLKRHKCKLDESLPTKWNGCAPSTSSRYLCFLQICSLPLNVTHSNKSLKPQIVEVSELRGKHVSERCHLRHLSHFPLKCEIGRAVRARKKAQ